MPAFLSLCNRFANVKICTSMWANGVLFHFALKFMLQIICESACELCNRYAETTVVRLLCFVLFFIFFFLSIVLQKAFAPCDLKSKHNNIILDLYHIANYVVWIWNQNSKLHIFIHMRMRKDGSNMVYIYRIIVQRSGIHWVHREF